jgi:hypothetical protein
MGFVIECDLETALSLTNAKTIKGDLLKAKYQTQIYYLEEMIHQHFDKSNPNLQYGYRPNKMTYEFWKKKYHPTAIYQLVLSGRLRNAVLNGRVDRATGKISFSLPEYGLYQLKAGRDFVNPSAEDRIILQSKLRNYLFNIRSLRAKMSRRK